MVLSEAVVVFLTDLFGHFYRWYLNEFVFVCKNFGFVLTN